MAGLSDLQGTELTVRHRACLVYHDGKLYTFMFTADLEAFPTAVLKFEQMLASLKWDKPAGGAKPGTGGGGAMKAATAAGE